MHRSYSRRRWEEQKINKEERGGIKEIYRRRQEEQKVYKVEREGTENIYGGEVRNRSYIRR